MQRRYSGNYQVMVAATKALHDLAGIESSGLWFGDHCEILTEPKLGGGGA